MNICFTSDKLLLHQFIMCIFYISSVLPHSRNLIEFNDLAAVDLKAV